MVKGVHQNIIEINDTGNKHFERAILFVRSGQSRGQTPAQLREAAEGYLKDLHLRSGILRRLRPRFTLLKYVCAAGLGAACAAILLCI